jgi:hypothetical protein
MSYKDTKKQLKEQGMILKSWYKCVSMPFFHRQYLFEASLVFCSTVVSFSLACRKEYSPLTKLGISPNLVRNVP